MALKIVNNLVELVGEGRRKQILLFDKSGFTDDRRNQKDRIIEGDVIFLLRRQSFRLFEQIFARLFRGAVLIIGVGTAAAKDCGYQYRRSRDHDRPAIRHHFFTFRQIDSMHTDYKK